MKKELYSAITESSVYRILSGLLRLTNFFLTAVIACLLLLGYFVPSIAISEMFETITMGVIGHLSILMVADGISALVFFQRDRRLEKQKSKELHEVIRRRINNAEDWGLDHRSLIQRLMHRFALHEIFAILAEMKRREEVEIRYCIVENGHRGETEYESLRDVPDSVSKMDIVQVYFQKASR